MAIPQVLSVASVGPRVGWDVGVPVRPDILVRFNQPILTSLVNTTSGANSYFNLVRLDNDSTQITLTYGSWDSQLNQLIVNPSADLVPGVIYQVTIRKEITSAAGRPLPADYTWTFLVAGSTVSAPILSSPGDATAFLDAPTLVWTGPSGTALSGSVTYDVYLHTDWAFTAPLVYSTTVTASGSGGTQSNTIGATLSGDTAYYWKVRARTASATGDWSETRAFWIGSTGQTSPPTVQLYEPDVNFRLNSLLPVEGSYHLSEWPTILATFSSAVDSDTITTGNFQVWQQPIDGSLAEESVQLSGVFTVAGNQALFTPSGDITYNHRYTIVLTPDILGTDEEPLEGEIRSYFTSQYRPLYGGVLSVRAELGGFIDKISDDEITFALWRASLEVNEILDTRGYMIDRRVGTAGLVNYQYSMGTTWGMSRYAELTAAMRLLDNFYMDVAEEAGRKTALATFQYERSVDILKELRAKGDAIRAERNRIATQFLQQMARSRVGIQGQNWHPSMPSARDWGYTRRPGVRQSQLGPKFGQFGRGRN